MTQTMSDEALRELLRSRPVIALVGASKKPVRPSHHVMTDLIAAGYEVIPVHPAHAEVLGRRTYPNLAAIPGPVDIVDVFRRSDFTPDVARQAVAKGARVLWLQVGVISEEARRIAEGGGLMVVMDRCLSVEHYRLLESDPATS
jgi:predicted CoA-binding protein